MSVELNTPMGPGWFLFFHAEVPNSGGYYHPLLAPKIKIKRKEYETAKIVIENAHKLDDRDLELMLRLRLQQQGITLRISILEEVLEEIRRKRKKRKKTIAILLSLI